MSSTKRKTSTTPKPKKTKTRKVEAKTTETKTPTEENVKKTRTQKAQGTKRKRAPKKKKTQISRYHQFKDFLIANKYSLRDIKEFELSLACSILQKRNMELQIKLNQDADTDLIIID